MSAPEPIDPKRDGSLPPGCKDLIDAIHAKPEPHPQGLPPITDFVTLPDLVAVSYLADLLHMTPRTVGRLTGYGEARAVPFVRAAILLRKHGIQAERKAS